MDADLDVVHDACRDAGRESFETADETAMERLWAARRNVYPAACEYRDDATVAFIGDVVVPVSKYPEIVEKAADLSAELDLTVPCVGHAGDGNLHFLPVADLTTETRSSVRRNSTTEWFVPRFRWVGRRIG